jgi:hypothetical protein
LANHKKTGRRKTFLHGKRGQWRWADFSCASLSNDVFVIFMNAVFTSYYKHFETSMAIALKQLLRMIWEDSCK